MIRVLLVEDSLHILTSLSGLISTQPDFLLVGTARNGIEAITMTNELLPTVVVMDAQMPRLDGVGATRRIKREWPSVGILFFSVFTDDVEASIVAGADGYLTKDCSSVELFDEIRRIASCFKSAC